MFNIISPSRYKINKKTIKKDLEEYFISKNIPPDYTLNIIFVGKNKMRKLSANYKQEDVALPVLSFFYNEKQETDILMGEIFICYPQAVLLAAERNKKVDEMIKQLIIHGVDNLLKSQS